jgi:hypothetical protein
MILGIPFLLMLEDCPLLSLVDFHSHLLANDWGLDGLNVMIIDQLCVNY